jgi:hypothetical protein
VKCTCGVEHKSDKKHGVSGRLDKFVEVEDHGNGYMLLGTTDEAQARRVLEDYVDNIEDYRFAAHTLQPGPVHAVWLAVEPFAVWDGATQYDGTPLPR